MGHTNPGLFPRKCGLSGGDADRDRDSENRP